MINTHLKSILSGLLLAPVLLLPSLTHAASCHGGGGGQIICVLSEQQKFQFGMSTSFRKTLGNANPYGEYTPYSQFQSSQSIITQIGAAYRLHQGWQVGTTIPIFRNENILADKTRVATEIGDPTIEARYTLWDDLYFMPYRPELSVYGGTRIPVGKTSFESEDALATNAVGEGVFVPYFGLTAAKLYRPWKFAVDGSFFYPFEKVVTQSGGRAISNPYSFKSGNRIQLSESLSYLLSMKWGLGAGFRQFWQFESSVNGNSTQGSAVRAYTSFVSTSYYYMASLFFTASYESAFPFRRYLANQPDNQSFSLMAGYSGF